VHREQEIVPKQDAAGGGGPVLAGSPVLVRRSFSCGAGYARAARVSLRD
jgi:hypothetical protein